MLNVVCTDFGKLSIDLQSNSLKHSLQLAPAFSDDRKVRTELPFHSWCATVPENVDFWFTEGHIRLVMNNPVTMKLPLQHFGPSNVCLVPTSSLVYSSTQKMYAICSSETSVDFKRNTWRYMAVILHCHGLWEPQIQIRNLSNYFLCHTKCKLTRNSSNLFVYTKASNVDEAQSLRL
jgi:hypothetical protein